MRMVYIYKAVAMCFLLFTAADIINPHFCSEELGSFSLPAVSEMNHAYVADNPVIDDIIAITATDAGPQHEQSPEPTSEKEDCFCCCSHIVPGIHFSVDQTYFESPATASVNMSIPTPLLQGPFHPPRLS